ncbi:hypothetical protein RRG08_041990 [Elysia crispata]|uniref:Uncharacterized protein n=1 Tax=Elysia crispata TaxID=231223 RepID=A0AAE0YZP2_9GAST|nr:hypothetical protein RRG08_041990 [Elysia crispata]
MRRKATRSASVKQGLFAALELSPKTPPFQLFSSPFDVYRGSIPLESDFCLGYHQCDRGMVPFLAHQYLDQWFIRSRLKDEVDERRRWHKRKANLFVAPLGILSFQCHSQGQSPRCARFEDRVSDICVLVLAAMPGARLGGRAAAASCSLLTPVTARPR